MYLDNCQPDEEETKGHLIGGKPGYDMKENPSGINVYIQDPKMSEVHAHIFCRRYPTGNVFILKDVSDHSNKDTSGIYVQLPGEEVDLHRFDYLERDL